MNKDDIIVDDEDITVLCPSEAIVKGMITIIPNKKYLIMEEVDDNLLIKMFQVANKLCGSLFEALKCEGTNILIQNGVSAGQTLPSFSINIIPRYSNDGLDLSWVGKNASPQSLEENVELIHNIDKREKEEALELQKKEELESLPDEEEADDYLTKSMKRLP